MDSDNLFFFIYIPTIFNRNPKYSTWYHSYNRTIHSMSNPTIRYFLFICVELFSVKSKKWHSTVYEITLLAKQLKCSLPVSFLIRSTIIDERVPEFSKIVGRSYIHMNLRLDPLPMDQVQPSESCQVSPRETSQFDRRWDLRNQEITLTRKSGPNLPAPSFLSRSYGLPCLPGLWLIQEAQSVVYDI